MARDRSIYVEIRIRGPLDEVWRRTQTPDLHELWDLRFSSIAYLPREGDEPQRFRYATRIGFGLEIVGWGETAGAREIGGARSSALRFGSEEPGSLIREGSGYWKYVPLDDEVRFITGYDYEVRFGALGRLADRAMFRPLMGWATAWSFDRLRLWIERGVDPRGAARRALVHALAATTVAFVWVWHGLVPKLLGPHPSELALMADVGLERSGRPLLFALGTLELAFGLVFVPLAHRRWPWIATIAAMLTFTAGAFVTSPHTVPAAFGPVTLNLQLAALAAVGLLSLRDLPSARRCLRHPPREEVQ